MLKYLVSYTLNDKVYSDVYTHAYRFNFDNEDYEVYT